MSVVEAAKQAAGKLAAKVGETVTSDSGVRAITIARPPGEVRSALREADHLSVIFGDIAEVATTAPDRMRWTWVAGDGDGSSWDCAVVEDEAGLRFTGSDAESRTSVSLEVRDAPQDRGTEVIARVSSPAPGALTGQMIFKALYRARALLMTGEVPTIKHNPSARDSDR